MQHQKKIVLMFAAFRELTFEQRPLRPVRQLDDRLATSADET
jgi:hypothetical protein